MSVLHRSYILIFSPFLFHLNKQACHRDRLYCCLFLRNSELIGWCLCERQKGCVDRCPPNHPQYALQHNILVVRHFFIKILILFTVTPFGLIHKFFLLLKKYISLRLKCHRMARWSVFALFVCFLNNCFKKNRLSVCIVHKTLKYKIVSWLYFFYYN